MAINESSLSGMTRQSYMTEAWQDSHISHMADATQWVISPAMNESYHWQWMSHITDNEWVISLAMNESYHTWHTFIQWHKFIHAIVFQKHRKAILVRACLCVRVRVRVRVHVRGWNLDFYTGPVDQNFRGKSPGKVRCCPGTLYSTDYFEVIFVIWLIYPWHFLFVRVHTWFIRMRHDSCIFDMTLLHHVFDMTHLYVTFPMHTCTYIIHSYETWLADIRHDSTPPCVWYDSFIRDIAYSYVTWFLHMRHHSFIFDMTLVYSTSLYSTMCLIWRNYPWHLLFIRDMVFSYATRLDNIRHDSTPPCVWYDAFILLIYTWHFLFIRDMGVRMGVHLYVYIHDSFIRDMTLVYVTWLAYMIHSCETRRIYIWHALLSWYPLLHHVFDMTYVYVIFPIHTWHGLFMLDSFIFDLTRNGLPPWYPLLNRLLRGHTCDTTRSYVKYSFTCEMIHPYVTWLIHVWSALLLWLPLFHQLLRGHMCDMTLSYVTGLIHKWHDSSIRDTTHLHVKCAAMAPSIPPTTSRSHVWHDSFICDMTHSHVTWLIHTWHDSSIRDMTPSHGGSVPPRHPLFCRQLRGHTCVMILSHATWLIHA